MLINEHIKLLILDLKEWIKLAANRFEVLCQLDSMIQRHLDGRQSNSAFKKTPQYKWYLLEIKSSNF
jgi:hypothetical protein